MATVRTGAEYHLAGGGHSLGLDRLHPGTPRRWHGIPQFGERHRYTDLPRPVRPARLQQCNPHAGSADSRFASTQPAEPAPTMV
jgi:hypothetical protein